MMYASGGKFLHRTSGGGARRRHAGFSLFELVVGITIVGLLGMALSERMLRYQEYAEKTAMEVTARNIQTGLRLKVADLMMTDRMHEIDRLLLVNPITWLETPPPNYIGERADSRQDAAVAGNWHFNTARREVVYVPFHRRFFEPQVPGNGSIRFRIGAVPVANANDARKVEGLTLLLLSPYKWEVQPGWAQL